MFESSSQGCPSPWGSYSTQGTESSESERSAWQPTTGCTKEAYPSSVCIKWQWPWSFSIPCPAQGHHQRSNGCQSWSGCEGRCPAGYSVARWYTKTTSFASAKRKQRSRPRSEQSPDSHLGRSLELQSASWWESMHWRRSHTSSLHESRGQWNQTSSSRDRFLGLQNRGSEALHREAVGHLRLSALVQPPRKKHWDRHGCRFVQQVEQVLELWDFGDSVDCMWRQVLHILEHWGCHRDLLHDIPLRWLQLCVIVQPSAVIQVGECPNPGFLLKVFRMAFSWGDFWTAFQRACAMHLPGDCQWWNLAGFDHRSPCAENELFCPRCVMEHVLQVRHHMGKSHEHEGRV